MPLDDEEAARDRLKSAAQRNTVQEYITHFDRIVAALPDAVEKDLIHAFVYGLK